MASLLLRILEFSPDFLILLLCICVGDGGGGSTDIILLGAVQWGEEVGGAIFTKLPPVLEKGANFWLLSLDTN